MAEDFATTLDETLLYVIRNAFAVGLGVVQDVDVLGVQLVEHVIRGGGTLDVIGGADAEVGHFACWAERARLPVLRLGERLVGVGGADLRQASLVHDGHLCASYVRVER